MVSDTLQNDRLFFENVSDDNLLKSNISRSEEYTMNNRQQKLHIRSIWPTTSCKGVVFFMHGYGAHSNRPTLHYLGQLFSSNNYTLLSMDFHGHGYSEGERGLVVDPCHLIDDVLCVLLALYGLHQNQSNIKRTIKGLPIFFMGHSMGGGIAIVVSHLLHCTSLTDSENTHLKTKLFLTYQDFLTKEITPNHRGTLLFCPVIQLSSAQSLVQRVLYGPASFYPTSSLPVWIFDENSLNHLCWSSPLYQKYIIQDGFPSNPTGLSYGGNIQLGTLYSLFKLADVVERIIHLTCFPFIVFHDPNDTTVPISGSQMFGRNSKSTDKMLVEVYDGLHDLLANKIVEIGELCVQWMDKRVSNEH